MEGESFKSGLILLVKLSTIEEITRLIEFFFGPKEGLKGTFGLLFFLQIEAFF